jgi:hypothetical protein
VIAPIMIHVDSVTTDPANVRKHSEKNIEAIKASLTQFGQRKPIVVRRENMTVIAGNGTLRAAKELGWRDIAAVIVDDSLETATKYAIADNRSAELAEWDRLGLGQLIGGLQDAGENVFDMGFDQLEIDQLLESHTARPQSNSDNKDKDGNDSNEGGDDNEGSPAIDSDVVPEYVIIGQECIIIKEGERMRMLELYEKYRMTEKSGKGFFDALIKGRL